MKRDSFKTGWNRLLLGFSLFLSVGSPIAASAQNMADYTNYPIFLNQTVPPNILFRCRHGELYARSGLQRLESTILDFV